MGDVTQERQELLQGRTYTSEPTEAGKKEYCGNLNGSGTTDSYMLCADSTARLPRVQAGGQSRKGR